MAELFEILEAQEKQYNQLVSGGVPSYKIKDNGQVILNSFFPPSTAIIKQFINSKKLENIIR